MITMNGPIQQISVFYGPRYGKSSQGLKRTCTAHVDKILRKIELILREERMGVAGEQMGWRPLLQTVQRHEVLAMLMKHQLMYVMGKNWK